MSYERPKRSFEEFAAFIKEETEIARREASIRVEDISQRTVACVDPLSRKGDWNPPGGGLFLAQEGYLDEYMYLRSGMSGDLAVHRECGYMLVEMSLSSRAVQDQAIELFRQMVAVRNEIYNTRFTVSVDNQGSAAPYMKP